MSEPKKTATERLAEAEARREAREAAKDEARAEQRILDLEAVDEALAKLGDGTPTAIVNVVHSPGLPTLVLVRCPKKHELARYRASIKKRNGEIDSKSAVEATEDLAFVTVLYPDPRAPSAPDAPSLWKRLCEERPGVAAGAGQAAITLSVASAEEEGKG
jgi:hypothetical protein